MALFVAWFGAPPRLVWPLALALSGFAQEHPAIKLFNDRQFPQAEKALRVAIKQRPQEQQLKLYLAKAMIEQHHTADALRELETLLAQRPSAETEFEVGKLMRQLAEARFHDLSQSDAGQAAVQEIAGRRLEREGNFEAALARYREAASLEPSRPGLNYEIGSALWKMRDYEPAEKQLRAELVRTPQHGMANFRLGQLMLATNREAEAVSPLEQALTALPNRLEVRRELGKAYRRAGQLNQARSAWESVATARPNDDQVHFLLGGLYRELGESALAEKAFARHRNCSKRDANNRNANASAPPSGDSQLRWR
ncbi:MAG: tetratricopeptide repeat protein [Chloroflexia bacterium]